MTGTSDRQTGSLYEFASVTRFLQQDAASPDTLALRASLLSLSICRRAISAPSTTTWGA